MWNDKALSSFLCYGAADSTIALATANVAELLDWLKQTSGKPRREDLA